MIRGVLCDLDGTVRLWPAEDDRRIEAELGLPGGELARVAFERELVSQAVTGALSDAAWREEIARRLVELHGEAGARGEAAWSALRGIPDPEMLALVEELRAAVPVVLLTNATSRLDADLAEAGLAERFDAIANSSVLGVAKPDPLVYARAAALVGLEPQECVLVDDGPSHVEGGRAAGAVAILHRSAAETRRELRALGLPV